MGVILPPQKKNWLHPFNNLEILLVIEKLDKIYLKIGHFAPIWAKIGLFLIRVFYQDLSGF